MRWQRDHLWKDHVFVRVHTSNEVLGEYIMEKVGYPYIFDSCSVFLNDEVMVSMMFSLRILNIAPYDSSKCIPTELE